MSKCSVPNAIAEVVQFPGCPKMVAGRGGFSHEMRSGRQGYHIKRPPAKYRRCGCDNREGRQAQAHRTGVGTIDSLVGGQKRIETGRFMSSVQPNRYLRHLGAVKLAFVQSGRMRIDGVRRI